MFPCIWRLIVIESAHVRDARPEPWLAVGDPVARELPRRWQGQDPHARQSLALVRGQDRGVAPGAQGRSRGGAARPAGNRAVPAARCHVAAVLGFARKLGLDRLVPRRPERLATLALALVVA